MRHSERNRQKETVIKKNRHSEDVSKRNNIADNSSKNSSTNKDSNASPGFSNNTNNREASQRNETPQSVVSSNHPESVISQNSNHPEYAQSIASSNDAQSIASSTTSIVSESLVKYMASIEAAGNEKELKLVFEKLYREQVGRVKSKKKNKESVAFVPQETKAFVPRQQKTPNTPDMNQEKKLSNLDVGNLGKEGVPGNERTENSLGNSLGNSFNNGLGNLRTGGKSFDNLLGNDRLRGDRLADDRLDAITEKSDEDAQTAISFHNICRDNILQNLEEKERGEKQHEGVSSTLQDERRVSNKSHDGERVDSDVSSDVDSDPDSVESDMIVECNWKESDEDTKNKTQRRKIQSQLRQERTKGWADKNRKFSPTGNKGNEKPLNGLDEEREGYLNSGSLKKLVRSSDRTSEEFKKTATPGKTATPDKSSGKSDSESDTDSDSSSDSDDAGDEDSDCASLELKSPPSESPELNHPKSGGVDKRMNNRLKERSSRVQKDSGRREDSSPKGGKSKRSDQNDKEKRKVRESSDGRSSDGDGEETKTGRHKSRSKDKGGECGNSGSSEWGGSENWGNGGYWGSGRYGGWNDWGAGGWGSGGYGSYGWSR